MHEHHPFNEPSDSLLTEGVACKQCGYDLRGLDPGGMCPECGLPVERSLTDDMLINSSPDYLRSLHSGVFLVLTGIIVQVVLIFAGIGLVFYASSAILYGMLGMVGTGAALMVALGWWRFSEPDPAFSGRFDGSKARKVVRITVLINTAMALINGIASFGGPVTIAPGPGGQGPGMLDMLVWVISIIGTVAWAVSFFASMLYLRWLCPRIPDWRAHKRAKNLLWLGPVLYIPGSCILIGPLIALVLYWNLLDWIRRDLKGIRAAQIAGPLAA